MGFIDRPQRVWWRKVVFQIHLWVGLLLAVYVVVISISGSALIFRDEITDDTPSIPQHKSEADPSLWANVIAIAQSIHPDYRVSLIRDESLRGKALQLLLAKNSEAKARKDRSYRAVYFDPSTGRMLADKEYNPHKAHPLYSFIADLHTSLLSGKTGRKLNSFCAALLLGLCISGLAIWWPGYQHWKDALSVRWKAGWKRINYDSHRAIGFWTLLAISMWSLTGVYLGYVQPIKAGLAKVLTFSSAPRYPKADWKPGDSIMPIDDIVLRAQQALPRERIHTVSFPSREGDSVYVGVIASESPTYLHTEGVFLGPKNGKVLYLRNDWQESKPGNVLIRTLEMLHFVAFTSIPLKIGFAILGLSPAVLTITGGLMWWNRVLSKHLTLLGGTGTERFDKDSEWSPSPDTPISEYFFSHPHSQSQTALDEDPA